MFDRPFKTVLFLMIFLSLGSVTTLLWAASSLDNASDVKLQQLQAQLNALGATPTTTNSALTDNQGNALAKQILAQQPQNSAANANANDLLAQITADQKLNAGNTAAARPQPTTAQIAASLNAPTSLPGSPVTPTTPISSFSDSDLNSLAFDNTLKAALPMTPAQIQTLRTMYMASQFAAANSPATPPRPAATSVFVDLSPGATPPVVRLAQGFVTSIVFVDSSGSPWPIAAYDVGNPSAFNIQWDKTSNALMIQATVLYTYGNLAVRLKGLDTPVMITLIPGQKAVDYRVDMRIPGIGPNGQIPLGNSLPAATNSDLLGVLDGVPPTGSKMLTAEGGDCQVWLANSKMYVRTRLTILSPGWDATLSSGDGMHAYEMQATPMLLVSQHGQVTQLKVEGF